MSPLQKGRTRKMLDLPTEDLEWFSEAYAGTSLTWLVSHLLGEFRREHYNQPTPLENMRGAAKSTLGLLNEL
jgi:hypothetical protein